MQRLRFALTAALLAVAARASAHPVPFSYLDLRLDRDAIEASLVVHMFDLAHDLQIEPPDRLLDPEFAVAHADAAIRLLQPRLTLTADGRTLGGTWSGVDVLRERQSLRLHMRYPLAGAPGIVAVTTQMFPYDPVHQTFINVYEGDELQTQAILDGAHRRFEFFPGTVRGVSAVVRRLVALGIRHILVGPDHLIFLIGLLLLGGSIRQLLVVVTAFTVANTVALSLAALHVMTPPSRIVDPAIALSIVYLGADNLLVRGGRDVRAWIAAAFGLVHGFGLAGIVREMDLPRRALYWSLASLNVGVEIGQVAVVVAVAWALTALRARSEAAGRQLAFAGSVVVIAAGTFWFIQRVFFPAKV